MQLAYTKKMQVEATVAGGRQWRRLYGAAARVRQSVVGVGGGRVVGGGGGRVVGGVGGPGGPGGPRYEQIKKMWKLLMIPDSSWTIMMM